MANRIIKKVHHPKAIHFSSPLTHGLAQATILANQANTAVQDYTALTIACKIPRVVVVMTSASNGITAFNVAISSGAELTSQLPVEDNTDVGQTPPTVNTASGLCLFNGASGASDQAIAIAAAYGTGIFATTQPDAIFPAGTPLTLRYVTGGSVAGGIKAYLVCIPVDLYPSFPNAWTWGVTNIG